MNKRRLEIGILAALLLLAGVVDRPSITIAPATVRLAELAPHGVEAARIIGTAAVSLATSWID